VNSQVYPLARRENNKGNAREEKIFMALDKFCSDGSDGSLAHVIDGPLEAMTHAECIAIIDNQSDHHFSTRPVLWCHIGDVDERWQAGDRDIETRLT
jgi:hypothetical protein